MSNYYLQTDCKAGKHKKIKKKHIVSSSLKQCYFSIRIYFTSNRMGTNPTLGLVCGAVTSCS